MPTYRVAELARLAGVTVRTLHHYDQIGLLRAAHLTDSGHRLYDLSSLIRLQQILTLKWMGFDLPAIKAILNSASYNLHESLTIQKAAVQAQIDRLNQAVQALESAIHLTEEIGGEQALGADTIQAIIACLHQPQADDWMPRYYTPAAWAGIKTRALAYTPADFERFAQEWQAIFAAFAQHQGTDPASPTVQALAAQMNDLIQQFTAGDADTLAGLKRFSQDAESGQLPADFHGHTPYENVPDDLREFIKQAYTIYLEQNT